MANSRYAARQVSRTDDRTDDKALGSPRGNGSAEEPAQPSNEERICSVEALRVSTRNGLRAATATARREWEDADESRRTRLIADLARLVREPTISEATRLAGLTLIGWLARRRPEEAPHAIGIDEARESERRLKVFPPKAR